MSSVSSPAPDFSASDSASISSDATLLTEPQVTRNQNVDLNPTVLPCTTPSRQLAGISDLTLLEPCSCTEFNFKQESFISNLL